MKEGLDGDQTACSGQKILTCQLSIKSYAKKKQVPVFQREMNPKHYIGVCIWLVDLYEKEYFFWDLLWEHICVE